MKTEEWEYLTSNNWGDNILEYIALMKKEGWELIRMENNQALFRRKINNHIEADLRYKQAYDD